MSISTDFYAELLARLIAGEEVQVWPQVLAGESRDTEPGLQPWRAKLVGIAIDHVVVEVPVTQYSPDGRRQIPIELIH